MKQKTFGDSITRRDFLALAAMGSAAALWPRRAYGKAERKKLNLIVIMADDCSAGRAGVRQSAVLRVRRL